MKKAWGVLKENWQTMGIAQKFLWVVTFPVMFPILAFVVAMNEKYGKEYKAKHGKRWDK